MSRMEIESKISQLLTEEAKRILKDDFDVRGIFVKDEYATPNIIHMMEIYKNKVSYENYHD